MEKRLIKVNKVIVLNLLQAEDVGIQGSEVINEQLFSISPADILLLTFIVQMIAFHLCYLAQNIEGGDSKRETIRIVCSVSGAVTLKCQIIFINSVCFLPRLVGTVSMNECAAEQVLDALSDFD